MKIINKVFLFLLILGMAGACENLEFTEKQLNDPNNPTQETAGIEFVYNNIQLEFNAAFQSAEGDPGATARMYMNVAFNYRNMSGPGTYNGLWGNVYNDMLPDIDALDVLAEGQDFSIHTGSAKVMKAYTLMMLVDLLGDVPLSDAIQGVDVISPVADPGDQVYAAAIVMLDEAIAELSGSTANAPDLDIFYDGDPAKWVTAANTIKFKAALNTGDVGTINALLAGGNLISTASEDFQFNYGSQRNNPNSRHPNYNNHYETGDGAYLSNYFMWLLRAEKLDAGGNVIIDPRIRYYFYRKVDDAAGQDLNSYSCHLSGNPDQAFKPAEWDAIDPRLPYCIAYPDGYSGRDHLNGEGIPPDGPIRTSWGLYPFGGDFDDNSFEDTREDGTTGGLGAGITPFLLSSYVDFMTAEAVLSLGATGNARTSMERGIRESLDKVESFEALVADKMGTDVPAKDGSPSGNSVKDRFGMTDSLKNVYVTEVLAMYDAATTDAERLNIVTKEFLIAAWGNGMEAYNMYKRTGYPNNMQPAIGGSPGAFPLSFFYPTNSVDRNANITQKGDLNIPVFWQDASIASGLY